MLQVVEEETLLTLFIEVCTVFLQVQFSLQVTDMPMHSPYFERRVFSMKRCNEKWGTVVCNEYGTQIPLVNRKKNYTLLVNSDTMQFVVAYAYDSTDNTWGQGHYFNDFYKALEFMYFVED